MQKECSRYLLLELMILYPLLREVRLHMLSMCYRLIQLRQDTEMVFKAAEMRRVIQARFQSCTDLLEFSLCLLPACRSHYNYRVL